jgi:hypothetical protein
MDWSEQIFDHQHDIKSLKLKCHPDKNGTGFVELNAYLEQISQYHNWEELIELAQSAQEIQDLYIGNYRYDSLKKSNAIRGKKLTMQMIVDSIHQEFDTAERILNEFAATQEDENSAKACEFPRYESNKSFQSHMFTLEHLSKHLDMVVNDLQAIKSNMQKNYKFDQFYWYFDKSPKWKTALDIDFDWKSMLNEKIQTKLLEGKSCKIMGLDPLSTSDNAPALSDMTQSDLVFYLLSPNFSSEMRFREQPRSLLEAYEFSQLRKKPKEEEKERVVTKRKTASRKKPKPKKKQKLKIIYVESKQTSEAISNEEIGSDRAISNIDTKQPTIEKILSPSQRKPTSKRVKHVDYLTTPLDIFLCDLKKCLELGEISKSKNFLYATSTILGYISTLKSLLPSHGKNVGSWIKNRQKFAKLVQDLPKNERGQSLEHGKTEAALNIFWKFLKLRNL